MQRTVLLLIILTLLSGCTLPEQIAAPLRSPVRFSPSRRYSVQLTTYAQPFTFAFSAFTLYDSQTKHLSHQQLSDVPVPSGEPSGMTFDWTPSERYLWITTDDLATSHGCDELFVYTGDGSRLVFDSAMTTSLCHVIQVDASIEIIAICPNDDLIFRQSGIYRLTPSTGIYTRLPSLAEAKC
jgi:hypothetical protein